MKRFFSGTKYVAAIMSHSLLILSVLLAAILFLPKMRGVQVYTVLSSSMEPVLPVGSIIYVTPCKEAFDIQKQDIIAYEAKTTLVVHRVMEADWEKEVFVTKGDNNKVEDASPVEFKDVVGKVNYHIPWVGYGLMMVQRKEFRYVLLVLAGIVLVLNLSNEKRRKHEQEDRKQN